MSGLLAEMLAKSRRRRIECPARTPQPRPAPSLCGAITGCGQLSLLAEFKRRSPSAPTLAPKADLATRIERYVAAGAAAISVLTEPTRFGGSLADLQLAASVCSLPILRKDFLVRPEQVQESAAAGAAAVLMIVRALSPGQFGDMVAAARVSGLDVLAECHDEADLERALAYPDVLIGINNRDLDTLRVDLETVPRLLPQVPAGRVVVAESGYERAAQLEGLRGRVDAVLIGSALMRDSTDVARVFADVDGGDR